MSLINNIKTMDDKQKARLKRKLKKLAHNSVPFVIVLFLIAALMLMEGI